MFTVQQPLNREVLAYLMAISAVYNLSVGMEPPTKPEFFLGYGLDLGRLRAHPELGSMLYQLSTEIPGVSHGYILGYNVLINSRGVVFAFAEGMMGMSFRIHPPGDKRFMPIKESSNIAVLSGEWHGYTLFGGPDVIAGLKSVAERALANVEELSDRYEHASIT